MYIPENMGQSLRAPKDPKDVLRNVTGSSAAAGSGEFHVYKNARRREAERIRFMESQAREVGCRVFPNASSKSKRRSRSARRSGTP